ncbi:carboxylesterase/lipase family protein [Ancylobacter polymorphus]|uniref:Carboxylic ester hydrolase n=1 Tax=Ancylobacter polymorphus TaxID=223390 RepID=A0A9E7D7B2_9HYPH|nr:carboxylesterase family protein [Ancylobacter polymorphus]UOK73280.1 carboxylesterase family protein [Ancylobacter polymorphus]
MATTSGRLVGASAGGIETWLGIPYAAPPVGPLRWQPPQPPAPWQTPTKANALPSSCAQNADLGPFARAGGSEDCLYLNVYRAEGAGQSDEKRAVFVWIHGGALQVGQGGDYDASKLARQGNAIVVTLNYRLGVFGFLAHPALDGEGHQFANYGLMDQQAALRWVKENIAAFGGDPNNVTISGESSGGNSVLAHIASPASKGLFQHVVAMSGGGIMTRHPAFGSPQPLDAAREKGVGFARTVGCERSGADCLRALSTKQVLDAQAPYMMFEFIIDGQSLPMHPADAYREGRINRATLVTGSTRDEGRFFAALPELISGKAMTDADYPVWIERLYGAKLAPEVLREYPLERYDSASEAYASANTDSMFACSGLAMNRVLADQLPVYAYEFSDRTAPSYVGPTSFPLLAAHTYELSYVFPGFRGGSDIRPILNPMQEKLSDEMVGYFANVAGLAATRGNEWPRFDPRQNNFMTFALPASRMVSGRFVEAHHCAFWDQTGVY